MSLVSHLKLHSPAGYRILPLGNENEVLVSDTELVQKAGCGDVQAFGELFQRHNRRVYSLCYRMTGNAADAEDLTQEAFVRLFDKISTFRGEAEFTIWLHRFAVNQVLMHFRRQKKRPEKTTEEGDVPETFSGPEDSSSTIIINRIALDRAIAELPPDYRIAFVLHEIEGYMHPRDSSATRNYNSHLKITTSQGPTESQKNPQEMMKTAINHRQGFSTGIVLR